MRCRDINMKKKKERLVEKKNVKKEKNETKKK